MAVLVIRTIDFCVSCHVSAMRIEGPFLEGNVLFCFQKGLNSSKNRTILDWICYTSQRFSDTGRLKKSQI